MSSTPNIKTTDVRDASGTLIKYTFEMPPGLTPSAEKKYITQIRKDIAAGTNTAKYKAVT
jgi:hypothetical protein